MNGKKTRETAENSSRVDDQGVITDSPVQNGTLIHPKTIG